MEKQKGLSIISCNPCNINFSLFHIKQERNNKIQPLALAKTQIALEILMKTNQGLVKGEEFCWSNPDFTLNQFLSNQITVKFCSTNQKLVKVS